MVCVSCYYGNSRVTSFVVMWLLWRGFWEAATNSGKEVRRSLHPLLHFAANFDYTPSPSFIITLPVAPSRLLSTFHISPCPLSTEICPPRFPLPAQPSLFIFSHTKIKPPHPPTLFISFNDSVGLLCLLTRHMNCCAVNSSVVTLGVVTVLSGSWWMCMWSICECV